jgi:TRAP-type C4-dicarboxylate transport system permease small subunit
VVRRVLDNFYAAAGGLAAVCLVAVLLVICGQMLTRWLGIPFPGSADYAGYFMASSSFLALAYTLRRGAHIRVGIVLENLSPTARRLLDTVATAIGTALALYLAWYAVRGVSFSWELGDVSQGQDATPLWIPQLPMALGSILLAVALVDRLMALLSGGNPPEEPAAELHLE